MHASNCNCWTAGVFKLFHVQVSPRTGSKMECWLHQTRWGNTIHWCFLHRGVVNCTLSSYSPRTSLAVCLGRPYQGKLLLWSHKPLQHEKVSVLQIELQLLLVWRELFCISSWENAPVFTRDTSEYIFRSLTWFGNAAVVSLEDLEEVIVNGWMG